MALRKLLKIGKDQSNARVAVNGPGPDGIRAARSIAAMQRAMRTLRAEVDICV